MTFKDRLERIKRAHDLIRKKSTGNPLEFSRKLNCSESTLYQLLADLRDIGAPIEYCRFRNSYKYESAVLFKFGFERPESYDVQST